MGAAMGGDFISQEIDCREPAGEDLEWSDEEAPEARSPRDEQLLERFRASGDSAAFEALVQRHGPMVLDVCQSVLRNAADAEDAFQETFVVLAKSAGAIRKAAALGSWLHGVAIRTSQKARVRLATRRRHEAEASLTPAAALEETHWRETLHLQLAELPERYRTPLVLCYLQGATQEAAALQLGMAKSTLRQRLEQGRELLRAKLIRAGLGPVAMLAFAAWHTSSASASVPAALVSQTFATVSAQSGATVGGAAISASAIATSAVATVVGLAVVLSLVAWRASAVSPLQPRPAFSVSLTALHPESDEEKATRLGRAAHQQAAAFEKLPRFDYQARYRYGVVDSLRAIDCNLETMKLALRDPVLEKDWIGFYERGFSWDEKRFAYEFRPGKADLNYRAIFGTSEDAWDRGEAKDRKTRSYVRQAGLVEFWDAPGSGFGSSMHLFDFCYLRLTPHRYWWGETVKGRTIHTMFFASLDEVKWKRLPAESFAEEMCEVVEATYLKGGDKAQRLWISQKTGCVRGVISYFANSQPNELARFDDYREVSPGVWIPFREIRTFPHVSEVKAGKQKLLRSELIVDQVRTDRDLSARCAEWMPKEGEPIQDQRFGTAVNIEYRREQSADEVRKLAEAEHRKQLEATAEFHKIVRPLEQLLGREAPALPAEGWLGGKRPETSGKPYLVHFWATWCGPCKSDLQRLQALSEKGLIVVGVHPPGTEMHEIEKLIADRKLNYSTLLATDDPNDPNGPKLAGYPAGVFPYCVLVDARGKVSAHGLLHDLTSAINAANRLAELSGKPAPMLAASEWLPTKSELKVADFKGKVVLLDFWGQWCGPCVAKLPAVEELHAKYSERGLVVIGVHSAKESENLAEFLREKKVTFPVMIDRGETAERYLVDSWPRYYLLDKSGAVVWGDAHEPPTGAQVEELLKEVK